MLHRIDNYGIIGNMRTVDLAGMNSSVDWYCPPTSIHPASFALTRGVWHFPRSLIKSGCCLNVRWDIPIMSGFTQNEQGRKTRLWAISRKPLHI
jgi:hypothetical protein